MGAIELSTLARAGESPGRVSFRARDRCPACAARDREVVWAGRFDDEVLRDFLARHCYAADVSALLGSERFELVRCLACALLYHARVLDDAGLARLYGEWIDARQIERFEASLGGSPAERRFELGRQTFKHVLRIRALLPDRDPLRLIDVGCGDGRTLRAAELVGFAAFGVDPSPTRGARAAAAGLTVLPTLEEAVHAAGGPVDAITMSEVLEHLACPRDVLEACARALCPGGALLLEVPDARGLALPPLDFEQLRVVHPLEHLNAFTPRTLEQLARASGFVPATRIPAHATSALSDVLRTELSRFVPRASTSRYFVRA